MVEGAKGMGEEAEIWGKLSYVSVALEWVDEHFHKVLFPMELVWKGVKEHEINYLPGEMPDTMDTTLVLPSDIAGRRRSEFVRAAVGSTARVFIANISRTTHQHNINNMVANRCTATK